MRRAIGAASVILAVLAVALVVAHLLGFSLASSRLGLSMAAVGAVAVLAVVAHVGALGSVSTWIRHHFRSGQD